MAKLGPNYKKMVLFGPKMVWSGPKIRLNFE